MNVKELIVNQSKIDIITHLLEKFPSKPNHNKKRRMERLMKLIEDLYHIIPVDTGHLILGIFHVDEDGEFLNTCLFLQEELINGFLFDSELSELKTIDGLNDAEMERLAHIRDFPDSYAFEFSSWNEILGYKVDEQNVHTVGAARLCAAIIWEMTFWGFDEETVEIERQKLVQAIRESEEIRKLPKDEQKKHYISAEKLFASCGIPEETEIEKQDRHRNLCREMLTNNLRTWQVLKAYLMKNPPIDP